MKDFLVQNTFELFHALLDMFVAHKLPKDHRSSQMDALEDKMILQTMSLIFFNFMIPSQDPSQDRFQSSEFARWNSFGTFTELVPLQILW